MVGDDEGRPMHLLAAQSHIEPFAYRWTHHGIIERGPRQGEQPRQGASSATSAARPTRAGSKKPAWSQSRWPSTRASGAVADGNRGRIVGVAEVGAAEDRRAPS